MPNIVKERNQPDDCRPRKGSVADFGSLQERLSRMLQFFAGVHLRPTDELTTEQRAVITVLQDRGAAELAALAALTHSTIKSLRANIEYLEQKHIVSVAHRGDLLNETITIDPQYL
jgi:hypothetical protein